MRTSGDERGDGPRREHPLGASPDAEATRVFVRGGAQAQPEREHPVRAPEPTAEFVRPERGDTPWEAETSDRTRVFSRAAADEARVDPADGPSPDATRTMSRPGRGARGERGPRSRRSGEDPRAPRPGRRRGFRFRHVVALVLLVAVALPVGTWGWVWYVARQDDRTPVDAIIVLGASQYNGRPSPIFEARLDQAAHLHEEGVAPMIVTVGGNQPGDNYTEGGSGRDWLVEGGVPDEQVVAIGEGSDTLQSIEAVSEVFRQQGWTTAVIVTDPWHSLRSRIMAEDFDIEATTSPARSGPAVQERETQLWYITRETASLWYYWIFGNSSDINIDAA
ncbi:uncharacterized SAM-binding protein YcdF (DUF218 family) [Spinactinospora alkalitolerans]|uniref:Uncharacterized SAM-binding protein YcdF (DUF218 family) n=1 Tax=Spinactinospora alkalitolerans TaxID=687207 RepID=A0A852U123_9ACTN|nr:ElyC/SanA/YdcF family protein [Spinactinospora alkalitolerans]NYE49042.1 uncharacterized SAM-binding protein YcdF (DUF218 family) [Spinactinospora alkalitolerans]